MLYDSETPLSVEWSTALEEVAACVQDARGRADATLANGITGEVLEPPTVSQVENAADVFGGVTKDLWKRSGRLAACSSARLGSNEPPTLEADKPPGYYPGDNWETDLTASGRQVATASNMFSRVLPDHLQDVPGSLLRDAVDLGRLAGRLRHMSLNRGSFGDGWATVLDPIAERVSTARDLLLVGRSGGAGTDETFRWEGSA